MKQCKENNCVNPVFTHGYCRNHSWIWYNAKKKKSSLKQLKINFKDNHQSQVKLFQEIWKNSDKKSFLTGISLKKWEESKFFFNLFAHVLPKGKYPELKYKIDNIILLTPGEHWLLDFGTEEQRNKYAKKMECDWGKVWELKDKLKLEYL